MAILSQMWKSYKESVCEETIQKQTAHFDKWREYIQDIGFRDVWLRSFSPIDKNFIMTGFANQLRQNKYGKIKKKEVLLGGTVAATIGSVSKTFQENALLNPTLDGNNQKSIFIKNLIRSFKTSDAPPEGQQCLPLSSFTSIYNDSFFTFIHCTRPINHRSSFLCLQIL